MITTKGHTRNVSEVSSFIMPPNIEKQLDPNNIVGTSSEEQEVMIFKLNQEMTKLKEELDKANDDKKELEDEVKRRNEELYQMNEKQIMQEIN